MRRRVIIEKGSTRLYFEAPGHIRIDRGGGGLTIELTEEERIKLSRALWYASKPSALVQ